MNAPARLAQAATLGLFLVAAGHLGLLDVPRLARGAANIATFTRDLVPPDRSVVPTVARAMLETVEMAFVGTLIGFALALPMALFATQVVGGTALVFVLRAILTFVRTIPSLLWAIVFVVAVGLGPAAGTLGLALYSLGYLGKLLYEAFDGVDPEVIEATRAVGASRLQLARHAVLPETAHIVLAQLLFVFEYNVRASSILGFVGAGGVGFYLLGYLQALQYQRLSTALLITFAVVVVIDLASARLRRRFLVPALAD